MSFNKKWVNFSFIFIIIFFVSSSKINSKSLNNITLQLKWKHQFQFAGYYAAVKKGFYKKFGLKVQIIEGGPNIDITKQVITNKVQYGVLNSDLLLERLKGKPVVVLAAIMQHSPYGLFSLKSSGIKTPHHFINKHVMVSRNSDSEFRAMCMDEGVPLNKIKILNRSDHQVELIINKKIHVLDGYITNEAYELRKRGYKINIIQPINYGIDFYGDCLFTSENEINNNPNRVDAFLKASLLGWKYAVKNELEIIDYIIKKYTPNADRERLIFEASVIKQLMHPKTVNIGYMNKGRWQGIASIFQKVGIIKKYNLDGFIYDKNKLLENKRKAVALLFFIILITIILILLIKYVTNLKKTKDILKKSEEKYLRITENAKDIIYRMSLPDGKYEYLSQACMEISGYPPQNFYKNPLLVRERIHPDSHEYFKKEWEKILKGENPSIYEYKIIHKSGEIKWLSQRSVLIKDKYGKPIAIEGIVTDATYRKKIEEERKALIEKLQTALEKSEESNKLKKEFLALMSHEIRTPLTSIIGFSKLVIKHLNSMDTEKSKELEKYVKYINKSSLRLSEMLTNLLELSVLEAGRQPEFMIKNFNIEEMINDIFVMLNDKFEHNNNTYSLKINCENIIYSTPFRIQQILFNLIGNATKFTNDGHIDVSVSKNDKDYLFKVADTGIGIEKEQHKEIFDIFKRVDSKTNGINYHGVGLGLTLCKKLIEELNGTIWLESEVNKGTTFYFTVPFRLKD